MGFSNNALAFLLAFLLGMSKNEGPLPALIIHKACKTLLMSNEIL